jgi:hypothetical protein
LWYITVTANSLRSPGGRSARKNALQVTSIDDGQPVARCVAGCASASPGSSNLALLTTAPTGRVAASTRKWL